MKVLKLSQNLDLDGSLKSVSTNWKREVTEKSSLHAQSASSSSSASRSSSWSCSYSSMVLSLSVPPATDGASSPLSFFKPSSASLPLPLHFLCLLPFNFPALALPFSQRPPLRPSLALFLHSFHAALGLPKRLGLNGENLLWYNEPAERGDERERRQWGRGAVGRVGTDGGMQMHESGCGERRWEEEEEAVKSSKLNK